MIAGYGTKCKIEITEILVNTIKQTQHSNEKNTFVNPFNRFRESVGSNRHFEDYSLCRSGKKCNQ